MSEHSTTASMMEADRDGLPSYLRVLPEFRVVLCITHGCCYTRQNLSRHLSEKHQLKGRERQRIESSSHLNDIATCMTDVVQPPDGTKEIRGLPAVPGFLCLLSNCSFRSTSRNWMQKHYNKKHQWKVVKDGAMPRNEAHLQTLFQQPHFVQYFEVDLADQVPQSSNTQYEYPHANTANNAPVPSPSPVLDNALDQIMGRYQRVGLIEEPYWFKKTKIIEHNQIINQVQSQPQRDTVEDARHVSELTPWMKRTSIQ
ncbi:hypothetical protein INT44_006120, partial [Umbelopsis vinacea]